MGSAGERGIVAKGESSSVKIGFPVACECRGGNKALGRRGRRLWIEGGRIGHGELSLTHSLPLAEVASIEVTERGTTGTRASTFASPGLLPGRNFPKAGPRQFTDVRVHTRDGQTALWIVERRGGEWVRDKLAPALHDAGVPFHDELPPGERAKTL
jgi:hypothetical protein